MSRSLDEMVTTIIHSPTNNGVNFSSFLSSRVVVF